jgi:alanyl-tRNA synthetase
MTKKIFWTDPYRSRHETRITTVNGADITVDETIFFAFSGGQESDHGSINGIPVITARRDGLELIYTLPPEHGLTLGEAVNIEIDWARRSRLMRLHFAAELVLELFYKKHQGIDKVGAHIAQNKARIDFLWPQSIAPLLPALAEEANAIIAADLDIIKGFDDEANERRFWEIPGLSRVPCGGTHVSRTGEIGPLRLKRENIGKGKERVEIYLAD